MKYGIIGTGWIAESFIKGVRLLTNSEISAVYSRTKEKGYAFAFENGIKNVYTSLNEFAAGDFDAVYIASPNVLHYAQSILMLQNGKHVICEKPITVNPEQFRICSEYAEKNNLVYMEAIMYMHSPDRENLRNALKKIGRVSSATLDFSQLSSKYKAYLNKENPNIFNPAMCTGCLMDLGIYCVYPAIDLFGIPDEIISASSFLDTGSDGSGASIFKYDDKIVTLTYSKTGQDYKGSCIYGDEGTIEIGSVSKMINVNLVDASGIKTVIVPDRPKEEIMGYEAVEFEKFISSTDKGKYELCTEMSLKVNETMEIIRRKSGIEFREEK